MWAGFPPDGLAVMAMMTGRGGMPASMSRIFFRCHSRGCHGNPVLIGNNRTGFPPAGENDGGEGGEGRRGGSCVFLGINGGGFPACRVRTGLDSRGGHENDGGEGREGRAGRDYMGRVSRLTGAGFPPDGDRGSMSSSNMETGMVMCQFSRTAGCNSPIRPMG